MPRFEAPRAPATRRALSPVATKLPVAARLWMMGLPSWTCHDFPPRPLPPLSKSFQPP